MKTTSVFLTMVAMVVIGVSTGATTNSIPNRLIDYAAFQRQVKKVAPLREGHRLTEKQFLDAAGEPDTIVLDARSRDKYAMIHIKGAINLPLTDFTEADLAKVIPAKTTRILIYCNNNFLNSPRALASKAPSASLNLYTFNNLVSYGYNNVYELGPLLDVRTTKLPLEGSDVKTTR